MIRLVRYDRQGRVTDIWEGTPSQALRFLANEIRTGWVGR